MSIAIIRALPIGNALQIYLQPPAGAEYWRILRKDADTFSGPDDTSAVVVHDGNNKMVVDDQAVANGAAYWYRAYYWTGSAWSASASESASAAATYRDESIDAIEILRDRIEAGLKIEVQRGMLKHERGRIPVLLAPPVFENSVFPIVTLHLQADSSTDRSAGEMKFPDVKTEDVFTEGEGWLAQTSITVMGWSTNPDERHALRRSLKRIIVGNLPVFDYHGMVTVDFHQQDVEDFQSYNAPVYQTMGSFTCRTPTLVSDDVNGINDVQVQGTSTYDEEGL